jgi:hypothetical protein
MNYSNVINITYNIDENTILSNNNIVFKIAFAAFIGHGFLDLWPLCRKWDWLISLPYYLIISFSTIYLYLVFPLFIKLLFFAISAYHFGSDWEHMSRALFLGTSMVGVAMGGSPKELERMGFPDTSWLVITAVSCGIVSIIPFIKNPKVWIFPIIGLFGIYGVMFYAVFIHTPRSVYLLAKRYGGGIYIAWIGFTILCFAGISLLEAYIDLQYYARVVVGSVFGVLFAHIICTYLWRDNEEKANNIPEANTYQMY